MAIPPGAIPLGAGIEGLFKKYKVDYVKGKGKILEAGKVAVTDAEGKDVGVVKVSSSSASLRAALCALVPLWLCGTHALLCLSVCLRLSDCLSVRLCLSVSLCLCLSPPPPPAVCSAAPLLLLLAGGKGPATQRRQRAGSGQRHRTQLA
jgi:hypothetical protein